PPGSGACHGIPELPGTKCDDPTTPGQGNTRFLSHTDMIVWPEAPNSFYESDSEFRMDMSRLARTSGAPIIVGNIGIDADRNIRRGYDLYNSANFIRPDGTFDGRYDKMHL